MVKQGTAMDLLSVTDIHHSRYDYDMFFPEQAIIFPKLALKMFVL